MANTPPSRETCPAPSPPADSSHPSPLRDRNKRRRSTPGTSLSGVACKLCRSKKVKCDGEYPTCCVCAKAGVPCIIADPSTLREYTRSEVFELEQRLEQLEATWASHGRLRRTSTTGASANNEPGVGTAQPSFNQLLNPQSQHPSIFYHPPHSTPPKDVALAAIQKYFEGFHIAHPFLDQQQILNTLDSQQASSLPCISWLDKQRLCQLNMVLAIGSITSFRDGSSGLHPFGFFTAALEACPPSESAFNSIEDIENFLLIARFGIYYNIGCSLWELGRLCVRLAIELGLHQSSTTSQGNLHTDSQRRRIVFWEVYLLDRFSSSTLGRPFAIDDSAIDVGLPTETPDQKPVPAVLNTLVKLGQLTSSIHCSIHHKSSSLRSRATEGLELDTHVYYIRLGKFASALRQWRRNVPVFDSLTCLFETPGFFELQYQKTRMWLMRSAIDALTASTELPDSLLRACLQSAYSVIITFQLLRDDNLVTFTRSYAHLVFLASLVIGFVVSARMRRPAEQPQDDSGVGIEHWLADLVDETPQPSMDDAVTALGVSSGLLNWFAENMPDVAIYAQSLRSMQRDISTPRVNETATQSGVDGLSNPMPPTRVGVANTGHSPRMDLHYNAQETEANRGYMSSTRQPCVMSGMTDAGMTTSGFEVNWNALPNTLQDNPLLDGNSNMYNQEFSWAFPSATGIEGIDLGISEYIWDTITSWNTPDYG